MEFHPCPFCKTHEPTRVRFTPWGGVLGPALLTLVKCSGCGGHFNGKNGRSVKAAIKLYTLATLIVLVALMALAMYQFAGGKKEVAHANQRGTVAVIAPPAQQALSHA